MINLANILLLSPPFRFTAVTPPADTGVYILGGGSVNGNVSSIEMKKKRKKKKKADLFAAEKKRFDIQHQYEEEMLLMACLEEWN